MSPAGLPLLYLCTISALIYPRSSLVSIFRLIRRSVYLPFLFGLLLTTSGFAQTISSLTPSTVSPGERFVLTVLGNDFASDAVVQIHTANAVVNLPTYFVNSHVLMAGVTSSEDNHSGSLRIDVENYSTHTFSNFASLQLGASGSDSGSSGSGSGSSSGSGSPASGSGSGSGSGGSAGSGSGTGSGSGSTGGSGKTTTSPAGSPLLVTVTSPSPNQSVAGSVAVVATAKPRNSSDSAVASWAIFDRSNLLWIDLNSDPSIDVNLALSAGAHELRVVAYDDSSTTSTATVPVVSKTSGRTVTWNACIRTENGEKFQAMRISPGQQITGVLQAQMFNGPNCNPTQWTDQLNDLGQRMTFSAGSSWLYWFIHRPDMPNVSAVWTMGNQTSGCVNYSTAPPCD